MSSIDSWETRLLLTGTLLIMGCTTAPSTTASNPIQELGPHRPTYLEGKVSATTTDFFTIIGLPKILVQVDSLTMYQSKGGAPLSGLNDLASNTHVRVHGRMIDRNRFLATRIQVSSSGSEASSEGLCLRCSSQL